MFVWEGNINDRDNVWENGGREMVEYAEVLN